MTSFLSVLLLAISQLLLKIHLIYVEGQIKIQLLARLTCLEEEQTNLKKQREEKEDQNHQKKRDANPFLFSTPSAPKYSSPF
jgi:hypothetical protein